MKIIIAKDYNDMSQKAAQQIMSQVTFKEDSILGLATGSSPLGTYKKLIEFYQAGLIDFSKATSFNLDEYLGVPPDNPQSYRFFMEDNLLNHINIPKERTFVPNGMATDVQKECDSYEEQIKSYGGVDLQLLGIGHNGHVGFNEPSTYFTPPTHQITLKEETIRANARFFNSIEEVPTQAVTMGIQTIMSARKVLLVASGKEKAGTIQKTLQGKIDPQVPASILQLHPDCTFILDPEAASLLK